MPIRSGYMHGWSEREAWVWDRIAAGGVADINNELGAVIDPADDELWTDDRIISSGFLTAILMEEEFRSQITKKGVQIVGAWFPDEIDLEFAEIGHILGLYKCRFDSDVRFLELKTSKLLSLNGSRFKGKVNMNGVAAASHLFMRNRAIFESELDLGRARIDGQLSMKGSLFNSRVNLGAAVIGGALLMNDGARFEGAVELNRARIDGQTNLRNATFFGKVNMQRIAINNDLFIDDSVFNDDINLALARINGDLHLYNTPEGYRPKTVEGASDDNEFIKYHGLPSLNIISSVIKGELNLGYGEFTPPRWRKGSNLLLSNAQAGALQLMDDSLPRYIDLTGFCYESLSGTGSAYKPRPIGWYMEMLGRNISFSRAPYIHLAGIFRGMGLRDMSDEILYLCMQAERKNSTNRLDRAKKLIMEVTVGYGYRTLSRLPIIAAIFVLIGALVHLYDIGYLGILFDCDLATIINSFLFSLDRMLPGIRLDEAKNYAVNAANVGMLSFWTRFYLIYIHHLIGWILTIIAASSIAGASNE